MQTPTIGRIVHVRFRDGTRRFNGSDTHPAIVVAAHSDTMINARVFTDSADNPMWLTSIEREDASDPNRTYPVWFWPPRDGGAA